MSWSDYCCCYYYFVRNYYCYCYYYYYCCHLHFLRQLIEILNFAIKTLPHTDVVVPDILLSSFCFLLFFCLLSIWYYCFLIIIIIIIKTLLLSAKVRITQTKRFINYIYFIMIKPIARPIVVAIVQTKIFFWKSGFTFSPRPDRSAITNTNTQIQNRFIWNWNLPFPLDQIDPLARRHVGQEWSLTGH